MRIFAVGLDLDVDYFEDKIDRHISMFRVAQLPGPAGGAAARVSCAPARTATTAA